MNRLLSLFFALLFPFSAHAADIFTINGQDINVPAPKGFFRVTDDMTWLKRYLKQIEDPLNDTLAFYISESDIPAAMAGDIPEMDRWFVLKINKKLRDVSVGSADFLKLKEVTKGQNQIMIETLKTQIPEIMSKMSHGVSKEFDIDIAMSVSQMVPLEPHYESENALGFSTYIKREATAGSVTENIIIAGTSTILHTSGAVLMLYGYGPQNQLEWTRSSSEHWAQSVANSNSQHSMPAGADRQTSQPESLLTPEEVFRKCAPSIVPVQCMDSSGEAIRIGTAVYIEPKKLLTNWHVIEGAQKILIRRDDGYLEEAQVTGHVSKSLDIAVLEVTESGMPIKMLDALPTIGQPVFALGNAEGMDDSFANGMVSGIRTFDGHSIIQTNARAAPGSSGGALLDDRGRLVGLITALSEDSQFTLAVGVMDIRAVIAQPGGVEGASPLAAREYLELVRYKGSFLSFAYPSSWKRLEEDTVADRVVIWKTLGADGEATIRVQSRGVAQKAEAEIKAAFENPTDKLVQALATKLAQTGSAKILKHYPSKIASMDALAIESELINETLGQVKKIQSLTILIIDGGRIYAVTYSAPPAAFGALMPDFRQIASTLQLGENR